MPTLAEMNKKMLGKQGEMEIGLRANGQVRDLDSNPLTTWF